MARTPKDPNPEFSQMPEMTIETVDYNMFYKPERASVSDGLVQLSKSLSSIVPSLTNFAISIYSSINPGLDSLFFSDFLLNKKRFFKIFIKYYKANYSFYY